MYLKLYFAEAFKMLNEIEGHLQINLRQFPILEQGISIFKRNERVDELSYDGRTTFTCYHSCGDADEAEVQNALTLLKNHYKDATHLIAIADDDYPFTNEIIKNIEIALNLAKNPGVLSGMHDMSTVFLNANQDIKKCFIKGEIYHPPRFKTQ